MDKKTIRYIAGGLFALNAIIRLISAVNAQDRTIWSFVWPVALLLIAVGLFADKTVLTSVGGFILAAFEVRFLILYIGDDLGRFILYYPILIAVFVLFAIAGLVRKASLPLGAISGLLYAISFLVYSVLSPRGILLTVLYVAGAVLMGFSLSGSEAKTVAVRKSATGDKLDRLIKLKDLLDKGVLTQEEFEEKKKQILG